MGGCQNYDPFWGTLNIRCLILIGIQKGTIVLTTTHVSDWPGFNQQSADTTARERGWPTSEPTWLLGLQADDLRVGFRVSGLGFGVSGL